ncbi:hypothetical protein EYR38_010003 [Pleurotus pulmonarius]|nr:hypothetical protein EYR38_010003 [Pleurotus pulmonarius]
MTQITVAVRSAQLGMKRGVLGMGGRIACNSRLASLPRGRPSIKPQHYANSSSYSTYPPFTQKFLTRKSPYSTISMSSNTQPRTAIVTGAAQGIGKAIAIQLANDGFSVVISDIAAKQSLMDDVAAQIKAKNTDSQTLVVAADVSSASDVDNLVAKTKETFGGLDVVRSLLTIFYITIILIESHRWSPMQAFAGRILYLMVRIQRLVCFERLIQICKKVTVEEWEKLFAINVRGVLLCYQAAARLMIEQKRGGRIIGASSIAGKKGSAMIGAYSASKFAIRSLTQTAACEWGVHGITVNAYAPGTIDTPMLREAASAVISPSGANLIDQFKAATPLGRVGEPEEIANFVSMLASEKSSYMTGQTITIDGGIWFD